MGDDKQLRAALRRLLPASPLDVESLIEQARRDAEARVRALLTDAFTEALLEQVQADPISPAPTRDEADPVAPTREAKPMSSAPAPEAKPISSAPTREAADHAPTRDATAHAPTPEADPDALGWYVYCIVAADPAGDPPDLEGIDPDHPVIALDHDGLRAVVSRVPLADFGEEPLRQHLSDMQWLERTARGHEHVLERVAAQRTTIPMRLCSIYRDEAGLRSMLDREAPALQQALAHLDGKTEWGVKAFADPDAAAAAGDAGSSDTEGDGTTYMVNRLSERRRREEAHQQLDRACEAIHAALTAVASEAVVSPPQRPEVSGRDLPMILNGSYLVADNVRDRFHDELARLGEEHAPLGIELEATGPWPPYNFVPGAIGAAW